MCMISNLNLKQHWKCKKELVQIRSHPFIRLSGFLFIFTKKKYNTRFKYITTENTLINSIPKFKNYLKSLKEHYLVVGSLDPLKILMIKEFYPFLVSYKKEGFRNTSVFSKKYDSNVDVSILNDFSVFDDGHDLLINNEDAKKHRKDSVFLTLTPNASEFPFGIRQTKGNTKLVHGQFLVTELIVAADSINALDNNQLCLSIGAEGKEAVFYKSSLLKYYFDSSKKLQHIYLELFAGSELNNWKKQSLSVTIFIWKNKPSHYRIVDCRLKYIDYNPLKWLTWE